MGGDASFFVKTFTLFVAFFKTNCHSSVRVVALVCILLVVNWN